MSRRPGIGAHYINTHTNYHLDALRYYSKQKGIYQRLPRYFKDKMFSKEQRAEMAETAEWESVVHTRDEIKRLSAFHPEPEHYYTERLHAAHDSLTKRINSKDKF